MRPDTVLIFLAFFAFYVVPVAVLIEAPRARKPLFFGTFAAVIAAGIGYLFYLAV